MSKESFQKSSRWEKYESKQSTNKNVYWLTILAITSPIVYFGANHFAESTSHEIIANANSTQKEEVAKFFDQDIEYQIEPYKNHPDLLVMSVNTQKYHCVDATTKSTYLPKSECQADDANRVTVADENKIYITVDFTKYDVDCDKMREMKNNCYLKTKNNNHVGPSQKTYVIQKSDLGDDNNYTIILKKVENKNKKLINTAIDKSIKLVNQKPTVPNIIVEYPLVKKSSNSDVNFHESISQFINVK